MLGGLVFTDNKARELLTRVSMSAGHTAIIYLPAFQIRKSTFPKEEIQEMAAEVTDAYNRALTGDVFGAMYENGRWCTCAALGIAQEISDWALACGAAG